MMVSARVFLILLVPLLMHGAPTQLYPHAPGHDDLGDPQRNIWLLQDGEEPGTQQHVLTVKDPDLPKTTCRLPPGTKYWNPSRSQIKDITDDKGCYSKSDRHAFILGVVVFLPSKTFVVIDTKSPNRISLPTDPGTEIRVVDQKDPFVQAICYLPKGTRKGIPSQWDHISELEKDHRFNSAVIVTIPNRDAIFLPRKTIVVLSGKPYPDYMHLPTIDRQPAGTKPVIRLIDKNEQEAAVVECKKTYKNSVPPPGTEREELKTFLPLCLEGKLLSLGDNKPHEVTVQMHPLESGGGDGRLSPSN